MKHLTALRGDLTRSGGGDWKCLARLPWEVAFKLKPNRGEVNQAKEKTRIRIERVF